MSFRAYWYNKDEVIYTDPIPIDTDDHTEATKIAYERQKGNPPAPILYLEEIQ